MTLIKKDSPPLYHSLRESKASLKGQRIAISYNGSLELTERQSQILKEKIQEVMGDGYFPEIIKSTKNMEDTMSKEEIVEAEKPKKKVISPSQIEEDEPVVGGIVELFKGRIEKE